MRRFVRKYILQSILAGLVLCLTGCAPAAGRSKKQTENVFKYRENEAYLSILWEDREYVPYCAVKAGKRGAFLGYVEGEEDCEIYEFAGYSSEEWLIDYLNIPGVGGEAMLFKESSVEEIPDGYESEYEWNG